MPKKTPRRSTKARNRVRRQVGVPAGAAPLEVEEVPVAAPRTAEPVAPRARPQRSAARRVSPVVDYTYLRRDLTSLAIFAPLMVVLVLISFVFLH